ncbi:MAG: HigA family addiction module antitoxin [Acutalibacteraceae bacterium]|nr:HigA family addiction module antitoxin [Acutalibacteraceae bacterium]MEE3373996.1 HigA family addiction module antitoxin [Acutalibacteraceae bacterium]
MAKKRIETPRVSEILLEEFMEPFGISAYRLAKDINVPVSRIQDILHDRRAITVDTSLRLGKYFGVSDMYFLNLQNDIDIRNEKQRLADELSQIQPVVAAS